MLLRGGVEYPNMHEALGSILGINDDDETQQRGQPDVSVGTVPAAEPAELSSISGSSMVEGKAQFLQLIPLTAIYTHIQK